MSDKEIKMSDVFDKTLHVDCRAIRVFICDGKWYYGEFNTVEQATAACLAINSYDANQQTIRRQQEVIESLKRLDGVVICDDDGNTVDWEIVDGVVQLSKLNGGEA